MVQTVRHSVLLANGETGITVHTHWKLYSKQCATHILTEKIYIKSAHSMRSHCLQSLFGLTVECLAQCTLRA